MNIPFIIPGALAVLDDRNNSESTVGEALASADFSVLLAPLMAVVSPSIVGTESAADEEFQSAPSSSEPDQGAQTIDEGELVEAAIFASIASLPTAAVPPAAMESVADEPMTLTGASCKSNGRIDSDHGAQGEADNRQALRAAPPLLPLEAPNTDIMPGLERDPERIPFVMEMVKPQVERDAALDTAAPRIAAAVVLPRPTGVEMSEHAESREGGAFGSLTVGPAVDGPEFESGVLAESATVMTERTQPLDSVAPSDRSPVQGKFKSLDDAQGFKALEPMARELGSAPLESQRVDHKEQPVRPVPVLRPSFADPQVQSTANRAHDKDGPVIVDAPLPASNGLGSGADQSNQPKLSTQRELSTANGAQNNSEKLTIEAPEAPPLRWAPADTPPARPIHANLESENLARPAWQPVVDRVSEQMVHQLRIGAREAVIQLEPPELGKIKIDLRFDGERMHARIVAEEQGTKALIESRLRELHQALDVRQVDVANVRVEQQNISTASGEWRQSFNDGAQKEHGTWQGGANSTDRAPDDEQQESAHRPARDHWRISMWA